MERSSSTVVRLLQMYRFYISLFFPSSQPRPQRCEGQHSSLPLHMLVKSITCRILTFQQLELKKKIKCRPQCHMIFFLTAIVDRAQNIDTCTFTHAPLKQCGLFGNVDSFKQNEGESEMSDERNDILVEQQKCPNIKAPV